ncbi:acyltransferase family protein [Enterobacter roggenkampii]|uniref:acyltransferase family protein n=1 Tax=Enterobacter roggenkampii TaxID=1812935 RepID=UPI0032AF0E47
MISKDNTIQLKAIAIIIVMIGHLITVNKTPFPSELRWTASFGVTIFLLLSGYGLMKSFEQNGLKGFFRKRLLTVLLPFYIMTVFTYLINGSRQNSIHDLFKTLTFTNLDMNIDGTMWYIYFISIWYIAFYVAARVLKSPTLICSFLFFISTLFILKNPFIGHENLRFQTTLHAFSFPIGVATSQLFMSKLLRHVISILGITACAFIYISQWEIYQDYKFILSCLSFGLSITLIVSCYEFSLKPLVFVGLISYEAYLIEGVTLRYHFSDSWLMDCAMFFVVTFCLAIALKRLNTYILYGLAGKKQKMIRE